MSTGEYEREWDLDQVKIFARDLRKRIGSGWDWMVPEVRKAMVAAETFNIVRMQFRDSVKVSAMNVLFDDMMNEMVFID